MSTRNKLLVLTAVMASLLEIIDTSIVNVAVPTMMGNLGSTLDEISWVITGYIIANAIVLPISSWMSAQIGRKVYYTTCIILFTAASVACGMAPNLPTLVVFRVLQGLAGGALLPTSQALIYESFPKGQAGMASAIYGMSVMIGPTIGPTLGGYLTDTLGWRSIFNINLPIGIVVAFLSFLFVEDVGFDPEAPKKVPEPGAKRRSFLKPKSERVPVDSIGLALLITAVGCLQFVLERGNAEDWFDSKLITFCLIAGVASLVGLIWWELHTKHPILQLKHFKNPIFRSGVMLMSILGIMLYSIMFIIPVFVSTIQGLTATQTGELFIPGALASAFMMPIIGKQLRIRDPRTLILIGFLLLWVAVIMIGRFNSDTSINGLFTALLLRGVAMAFIFVPVNSSVLSQFSGASIGEAAGLLNLCRQLGGSIGIASLSTLFQHYQAQSYSDLMNHVTWFSPSATAAYTGITGSLHAKLPFMVGMGDMSQNAVKLLFFRVKKQAFVLAFRRTLQIAAGLFVFSFIPIYLLKAAKRPPGAPEVTVDAH